MLRLLQAGLVAARRQFAAVIILTLIVSGIEPFTFFIPKAPAIGGVKDFWISESPFLKWAYLVIAIGLTLTSDRSIGLTAKRIRSAAQHMRLVIPEHASMALAFQLGLSAVLFAIFALRQPPELLIEIGRYFDCVSAASIGWSGTMSIGVACFGASAHAALKAL